MSNQAYAETAAVASNIPGAVTTVVPAVGRALISVPFLLSGLAKLAAPAMTIGYIQSVGLPLPSVGFALSVFVEILGGIALLLGFRTRIVASILFLFCLATAVFFHRNFGDQDQFIHFFKNVAMAGGLLHVVAFGGGRISLDGRRSSILNRLNLFSRAGAALLALGVLAAAAPAALAEHSVYPPAWNKPDRNVPAPMFDFRAGWGWDDYQRYWPDQTTRGASAVSRPIPQGPIMYGMTPGGHRYHQHTQ